jgi:hypothetical protein
MDAGFDTPPGTDGSVASAAFAMCSGKTDNNAPMFTADQFCALWTQTCSLVPGTTLTAANCVATYNSWTSTPDSMTAHGQQGCRSYHLCNAALATVNPHCYHAEGRTGQDAGANTFCMAGTTDVASVARAMCAGKTDNNATMFTAEQFCALWAQTCSAVPGVTLTAASCMALYNSWTTTPDAGISGGHGQQGCRSYHLCNAVNVTAIPHCYHAEGRTGQDAGANTFCM